MAEPTPAAEMRFYTPSFGARGVDYDAPWDCRDDGHRIEAGLIRECDRQRARIAAVLAECDWWAARTRSMPISRVRALLEGEGR